MCVCVWIGQTHGIWNYQHVIIEYRVCRQVNDCWVYYFSFSFSLRFFFRFGPGVWSYDNLSLFLFTFFAFWTLAPIVHFHRHCDAVHGKYRARGQSEQQVHLTHSLTHKQFSTFFLFFVWNVKRQACAMTRRHLSIHIQSKQSFSKFIWLFLAKSYLN